MKRLLYKLKGVTQLVSPVDGESLPKPQVGLSHGFQHYVDKDGVLVGYCGTYFWRDNTCLEPDEVS